MKTRLEDVTLAQFVNIACGDYSCLPDEGENPSLEELSQIAREILTEYREIASPGSSKIILINATEVAKERGRVTLFSMLNVMCETGEMERVREVYRAGKFGKADVSDDRLKADVKSRMNKAKAHLSELEKENEESEQSAEQIRKDFDAQTAAMMSHFKFQIDPNTMRANLYAHLCNQLDREIKAMQAAINKR